MKLYFSPGACSLSPHIVLRELGLPFDLVKVNLRSKQLSDGSDFCAINPKGYVPLLILDDGTKLTEGPAIVQYLADLRPESGLAPANGTLPRYQLQSWLNFISTELHKQFSPLFNPTFPDTVKDFQKERLALRFDQLSDTLKTQEYLMPGGFTVADAYLFTVLGWAHPMGISLERWPELQAYLARIQSRPSVQAAQQAEKNL
ncbi:glutathione transferase GstA [Ferrovum sp.]|uniref:glutathione transferase GstA n=1 Tax=Ferrovum sp. TaxID=2609467 RepID=UPI0026303880|nr:glutathione transferase GstA [Ferrovum sp.]